ncbi:MAG: ribonuclease III [Acidimicrobiales bacterium]
MTNAGMEALAERLAAFKVPTELLIQAMSHRSYCSEHPGQESNERLELLGDSVLGLVVTDHLYRAFPSLPEGDLARVRAAVVSTLGLAPIADSLGIGAGLLLGKGEESSGGRSKGSILVDCLEAVIGAVYLSAGFDGAQVFVESLVGSEIAEVTNEARLGDPKNRLQELAARLGQGTPLYQVTERGPDHAKQFTAAVVVGAYQVGVGEGRSKKDAERQAARAGLLVLASVNGELEELPRAQPG